MTDVMPNSWGFDVTNKDMSKDTFMDKQAEFNAIKKYGISWTALTCGFWYEYSLITDPNLYGFDVQNKKVTFYDDGLTKINTSTWDQCGRAVAAFLSLKELPENENDKSPTIQTWRNKPMFISSFLISQKDMYESLKRVTGDKDEDWTIEYEPVVDRYKRGVEIMKTGDRSGFGMLLYARDFYPNTGDYEKRNPLDNERLLLPVEDLDERTKWALKLKESGYSYYSRPNIQQ